MTEFRSISLTPIAGDATVNREHAGDEFSGPWTVSGRQLSRNGWLAAVPGLAPAPAVCLLALVLLTPGAAVAANAAPAAPTLQFYEGSFECYAGPLALRLPDSYPQLLRLGTVQSAEDVRAQTEHGLTTTERRIKFPGLVMTVYLFSRDPGRYQVVSVHIGSPAWRTLSPLRVGRRVDAVPLPRGWPGLPPVGTWEVQGDTARLLVTVKAGRIAAIDYVCGSGP